MKLEFSKISIHFGITTFLLWLLASSNLHFSEEYILADSEKFPWQQTDWLFKGDTGGFVFGDETIELYPASDKTVRESYILNKLLLPEISSNSTRLIRVRSTIEVSRSSDLPIGSITREREAGFMVWLFNKDQKVTNYLTVQPFPARTEDTYYIDKTIKTSKDTTTAGLVFMLRDSDAGFTIEKIDARLGTQPISYTVLQSILFFMYTAVMLLFLMFVYNRAGKLAVGLAVVVLFTTIVGVIIPDQLRGEYTNQAIELLGSNQYIQRYAIDPKVILFKGAHVLAFWIVTCLGFLALKQFGITTIQFFITVVLFAVSTEVLQMYSYDRDARLLDFGINMIGVVLGYLSFIIITGLIQSVKPAESV